MVKGFLRMLCVAIIFRLTFSEVVQVATANKSLHRTPDFGYVYFVFHPNTSLEVENPRQFHAQSYKPCAVTCARNKTCLSFNFGKKPIFFYQGKAQYLCELLSTDKYNSSSKYQSQNPDFDHYSIRSNCSKSPCLHNFTCIANYTEDTYECLCPRPAFEGKNCIDVDECATGQHVCSSNANCSNTIGSHNCKCKDGFFGNGKSCTDIDECTVQHDCSPDAICTNTIGSYKCTKIATCAAEKVLGMESREIPDAAITASSKYSENHAAHNARLNNNPKHWAPSSNRVGEWFQVDFGKLTLVTKVVTQGRPTPPPSYMTSYSLSYRRENESWKSYVHASFGETLPGNNNFHGTVTNTLDRKIATRYIRIYPKTWRKAITIQVEFYGCYLS